MLETVKLTKTPMMRRIERQYKTSIEQILRLPTGNRQLAQVLDLDHTTISKWRKKLREQTQSQTETVMPEYLAFDRVELGEAR